MGLELNNSLRKFSTVHLVVPYGFIGCIGLFSFIRLLSDWPYIVALLLKTIVLHPFSFITSQRFIDPPTLISQYLIGTFKDWLTDFNPAKCITASIGFFILLAFSKTLLIASLLLISSSKKNNFSCSRGLMLQTF